MVSKDVKDKPAVIFREGHKGQVRRQKQKKVKKECPSLVVSMSALSFTNGLPMCLSFLPFYFVLFHSVVSSLSNLVELLLSVFCCSLFLDG